MRPPNLITDHSREEKALHEVGVTSVATHVSVWLVGAFLMSILAATVLWIFCGEPSRRSSPKPTPVSVASPVPSGKPASPGSRSATGIITNIAATNASLKQRLKDFERTLEENSPLTRRTLPWLQAFTCRFLGQGNEKVYIGREGWLFYRPDVDHLLGKGFLLNPKNGAERFSDPIPALIRFKEDLAERGIHLLLVPIPSKAAIAPFYLSSRYGRTEAPLENPSYPVFLQQLRSHGIDVLDLTAPLSKEATNSGTPCYLRTDTHWTPAGMERIAELVAAKLKPTIGEVSQGSQSLLQAPAVTVTNRGDLAAMLKLPPDTGLYPSEMATIRPVIDVQGHAWKPTPSSEVLVLGDSFTRIYSGEDLGWGTGAGFAEQLSFHLQQPVDVLAINAGGSSTTRQALARSPERLNGVRTVVYEFAMRELSSGDWKVIPLSPPTVRKMSKDSGRQQITGTIAGITLPPPPGTTPYPDVITCLHLKDVSGIPEGEILVFVYGMRSNILTGAAKLQAGQNISLKIVPWETKEHELGSIQRREPLGQEANLEGVYWSDDYSATE